VYEKRYRKILSLGGLAFFAFKTMRGRRLFSATDRAPQDLRWEAFYTSPYPALIGPEGQTTAPITGHAAAVSMRRFFQHRLSQFATTP